MIDNNKKMEKKNSRVVLFDIMKTLCVIEIVAFWHMFDYTSIDANHVLLGGRLTSTVLATFTFASGFFLGKKQISSWTFYKSRLKRFMIPLLVSLLIMYLFGVIHSLRVVCFSAIGLSCFVPPMAPTLWFFSMIILCYIVTPFILYGVWTMSQTERLVNILLRGLLVYAVILLLGASPKVQMYFFFYIIGIIANMDIIQSILKVNIAYKFLLGVIWVLCSLWSVNTFITDSIGIILLIAFSSFIEKHLTDKTKSVFSKLSYASMFAYLFHREFYAVAKILCGNADETIPIAGIALTIIAIFFLSYYMQKIYDLTLTKIKW